MPQRLLAESICTSESISNLTWFEEVLFYRLMVNCDDFGRYDGRVRVLRMKLFPMRDDVTAKNIEKALQSLMREGMVTTYEVDGKPYLCLSNWTAFQRQRATKSKWPGPGEKKRANSTCCQLTSNDSSLPTIDSNSPTSAVNCRQMSPYSYSNANNECDIREREGAPAHVEGTAHELVAGDQEAEQTDPALKAYGKFKNVMLSDEDFAAFKQECPEAEARIEEMSLKLKSKGYFFADHYATLLTWYREDLAAGKIKKSKSSSFDTDAFERLALAKSGVKT